MNSRPTGDKWVRASEIGHYAYCARAWWLQRVKGFSTDNVEALARGTALHSAHGHAVARTYRWRLWAFALFGITMLCIVVVVWKLLTGS